MTCSHCEDGFVERLATPEEVDAGCELGIAYDLCTVCGPDQIVYLLRRAVESAEDGRLEAAKTHAEVALRRLRQCLEQETQRRVT